jgi:hypothetical protein
MTETLETKKKRARVTAAAALAIVVGFGVTGNGQSHKAVKKLAAPTVLVPSIPRTTSTSEFLPGTASSSSTSTTFVLSKAGMLSPLSPEGGDYNTATQVAYDATTGNNPDAAKLLEDIQDPDVKAQAEHVLQLAEGEQAARNAINDMDAVALSMLNSISLTDVKIKATDAVMEGIAAEAVSHAKDSAYSRAATMQAEITDPQLAEIVHEAESLVNSGDLNSVNTTLSELQINARAQLDALYSLENSEWSDLERHSTAYHDKYDLAQ